MARRNPFEEKKKRYFDCLRIKKIHPWLIYHDCIKCGDEFCREPMYECTESQFDFSFNIYYTGCTHCFSSKEDFRKYLEDRGCIYTEENFKSRNGGDIDH